MVVKMVTDFLLVVFSIVSSFVVVVVLIALGMFPIPCLVVLT